MNECQKSWQTPSHDVSLCRTHAEQHQKILHLANEVKMIKMTRERKLERERERDVVLLKNAAHASQINIRKLKERKVLFT